MTGSVGPTKTIALVGFMAAGKSTIGRMLAQRLDLGFVDTDSVIEAEFGMAVADIFRTRGEPEFRKAERDLIARLIAGQPQVFGLGGGAFVDPDTRRVLNASAHTVWLDPPFALVLSRLARSSKRPLASGKSESELRVLWDERREAYAQAHLRIGTSDEDPQVFVCEIVRRLTSDPADRSH